MLFTSPHKPCLQAVASIAIREALKTYAATRAADMYACISAELAAVRQHYEQLRRSPPKSPLAPTFGAKAQAAARLLARVEAVWAAQEVSRLCVCEVSRICAGSLESGCRTRCQALQVKQLISW